MKVYSRESCNFTFSLFYSDSKDLGQSIESAAYFFEAALSSKPVPQCSSVAFMKPDPVNLKRRNAVASNERCICYTVRGNLLRVLHLHSTEKLLLKGHVSDVLDLVFSPIVLEDLVSVLCTSSVDRTFIWRIKGSFRRILLF